MNNKKITQPGNEDIQAAFEELNKKAKSINPDLLSDIKSYADNQLSLESYQNFIIALNHPPVLTSSNHI